MPGRRYLPKLYVTHPSFFGIFLIFGVVFNLGVGVSSFTSPERYLAPSLDLVYTLAPLEVWGALHVLVWLLMTLGAYFDFRIARIGLALGFLLCLVRGVLIEASNANPGAGIFVWAAMAAQHFVQLIEPTINPITRRDL